ncbi:hypothetical protein JVX90_00805 [Gordonia sp. PDNC005]|uniref:hypothetical protein n=1 Tax=unclassified Gordonia (in: high G+C Gram-positive bacteria) TaxID=2657482 RepID=UPI001965271F|nr:hypothetical protein [Gordonia sp. PDNC005]QRY62844.1 hypothetical protein JVX90_00805 [Gordonia sp. PDNC005]
MTTDAFDTELERRLQLLESPDDNGMILPDLPLRDIVLCAVGLIVGTLLLLWWCL